jgi:chaperone modulatory protein CbpM
MALNTKLKLVEACEEMGIQQEIMVEFVQHHWISPAAGADTEWEFDEEDLARARLILELKDAFGVNNESIPIILHLLDQLYFIRSRLMKHAS